MSITLQMHRLWKRPEVINVILNPKPKTSTIDGQIVGLALFQGSLPFCFVHSMQPIRNAIQFAIRSRNKRKFHSTKQSNIKRLPMPLSVNFVFWCKVNWWRIDWTHNFGCKIILNRIEKLRVFKMFFLHLLNGIDNFQLPRFPIEQLIQGSPTSLTTQRKYDRKQLLSKFVTQS